MLWFKCDECGIDVTKPIVVETTAHDEGPSLMFCCWTCLVRYGILMIKAVKGY